MGVCLSSGFSRHNAGGEINPTLRHHDAVAAGLFCLIERGIRCSHDLLGGGTVLFGLAGPTLRGIRDACHQPTPPNELKGVTNQSERVGVPLFLEVVSVLERGYLVSFRIHKFGFTHVLCLFSLHDSFIPKHAGLSC
jgi:hypothetical protein